MTKTLALKTRVPKTPVPKTPVSKTNYIMKKDIIIEDMKTKKETGYLLTGALEWNKIGPRARKFGKKIPDKTQSISINNLTDATMYAYIPLKGGNQFPIAIAEPNTWGLWEMPVNFKFAINHKKHVYIQRKGIPTKGTVWLNFFVSNHQKHE